MEYQDNVCDTVVTIRSAQRLLISINSPFQSMLPKCSISLVYICNGIFLLSHFHTQGVSNKKIILILTHCKVTCVSRQWMVQVIILVVAPSMVQVQLQKWKHKQSSRGPHRWGHVLSLGSPTTPRVGHGWCHGDTEMKAVMWVSVSDRMIMMTL